MTLSARLRMEADRRTSHQDHALAAELNEAADEIERLEREIRAREGWLRGEDSVAEFWKKRAENAEATLQVLWEQTPDWSLTHEIITKHHCNTDVRTKKEVGL